MSVSSSNHLIENSMDVRCDVDVNINEGIHNDYYYCHAEAAEPNKCLSLASQLLACTLHDHSAARCSIDEVVERSRLEIRMDTYEKHSSVTLTRIWHIQCTIVVTLIAMALGRVARHTLARAANGRRCKLWWSQVYLLEFVVISVPVVISVNVVNQYIEFIVALLALSFALIVWRFKSLQKAAQREFEFGRRPALFTLLRSTISLLTALCILAIDFESFPKKFRKTRRYGAGLMDVGIGLFVFSMALVSARPKRLADLRKLGFTVGCMLVLGLARTLVITAIDYHQDEHEYGAHLNAFFTLGLTKLFGTLLGFVAKSDKNLLPLGFVILVIHEIVLQSGISSYVMDPDLERTNFLSANREGLCSLPGFIALFLLSQYFGQWVKAKDVLNYAEIKQKFKHLSYASAALWLVVAISTMVIGIARVTCNLGYVTWMLAIAVTMCSLFLFVFDIVLDTLYPVAQESGLSITTQSDAAVPSNSGAGSLLQKSLNENAFAKIPLIIESINYNGLLYFLLANVLTGAVNIFLNTDERTDQESVLILLGYMLITTVVVSLLYRYKIRIA